MDYCDIEWFALETAGRFDGDLRSGGHRAVHPGVPGYCKII